MSAAADQSQYVHLLNRVPLFRSLPEKDLASFVETLRLVEFQAGETIFEEGQAGEHFYVVVKGSLEIIKRRGMPEEERLAQRGIGDFIGEMSLLNRDGTRMASVVALEDSQLIEITRKQFDQLLTRHPLTAYEMVRVMSTRLNDAHESSIQNLTKKNIELTEAYDALKVAQDQLVEKERLERELELAADIQRSLLPSSLPEIDGYDFHACLQPARSVGGDLYDFIQLDTDNLGVIIGDVTDKGVPAALLMAQAQTLLRSEAGVGNPPAQVLHCANNQLYRHNEGDHFITVLYGVLHLPSGTFHYARAGHEAPWVCTADGVAHEVAHSTGQPLGILEELTLDEQRIEIPDGGFLLLHTDGLVDNLGGRDQSGDLLKSPLSELADSTAEEVCTSLMMRILSTRGDQPLVDDVTLVTIGRTST